MRKKIIGILVCIMLVLTTVVVFIPDCFEVKATSKEGGGDEEYTLLNTSYIRSITENLSKIVKDTSIYPPGTLAKGRFFGTTGERYAAENIISYEMDKIDLYNPCSGPKPYLQQIENLDYLEYPPKALPPYMNLTSRIETLTHGLTIINRTNPSNPTEEKITDFYISPFWNESIWNHSINPAQRYDKHKLTHNFTFENLSIKHIPTGNCYFTTKNTTWFDNFLNNITIIDLIINNTDNMTFYDIQSLQNLTMPLFENYYNFTFENLDPNDNTTWPTGFQRYDTNETDDYVMIEEHGFFNPFSNATEWTPPNIYNMTFMDHLWNQILDTFTWAMWYKLNPHCKGILAYDTDPVAYDMNSWRTPFPRIYINGTKGTPINQSTSNYNINYYINQRYNESTISYNVIGQINGTDPTKTVIISCLYDCWWNQGTVDSAIGMATVLAIAKYMKQLETDYNIKPRYNIKFVAFSGEEDGLRGACQYKAEATQNNENIVTMIDLNQLGFNTTLLGYDPYAPYFNIRFELWTNKLTVQPILTHNGKITDYTKRTGDIIPLYTKWNKVGGRGGNYKVFSLTPKFMLLPGFKTIYILKMGAWKYHHRDGQNHTEGDSFKYYDDRDVNVSAELIWNITKLFTINPNTWLENKTYELVDSSDDNNTDPDAVNISFEIKTQMPQDRVAVKATLYSKKHPIIHKYTTEKNYTITHDSKTNDTITIQLPHYAPKGDYLLKLHLYNSTGGTLIHYFDNLDINFSETKLYDIIEQILIDTDINISLLERVRFIAEQILNNKATSNIFNLLYHILDYYFNCHLWTNDSYIPDPFYMYPLDDRPATPSAPTGPTTVKAGTKYYYTTNTTDPDNDQIYYQWDWRSNQPLHGYSIWHGPYESGIEYTQGHTWLDSGENIQIRVRAKDHRLNPNVYSEWSDSLQIVVEAGCNFESPETIIKGQPTVFYGQLYGIEGECSYAWNFGETIGVDNNTQNPVYTYASTGYKTVNFTVTDAGDNNYYCEKQVVVADIRADFTTDTNYTHPNNTINFVNTSIGNYEIVNWTWDFNDGNYSFDQNASHTYEIDGRYNVTLTVKDNQNNTDVHHKIIYVDSIHPEIVSASYSPDLIGLDMNLTINADFYDNNSGVKNVRVNITKPDWVSGNYTMYATNSSPYDYEYVFTDTGIAGAYFYNIWVEDNSGNLYGLLGHSFMVSNLFGYTTQGAFSEYTDGRITGSVFTCHESCTADNITAYVYSPTCQPVKKSRCMIYRANDSVLVGVTDERGFGTEFGGAWMVYPFSDPKPSLVRDIGYILVLWSNGTSLYYDNCSSAQGRYNLSDYDLLPPDNPVFMNENRLYSLYCCYSPMGPVITNVSSIPDDVGFGFNVTLSADVIDEANGVSTVRVNVTYPDSMSGNYTMNNTVGGTYVYVFSDTWQNGLYNYTVWAYSNNSTSSCSRGHSFNVTAGATINVATLEDNYGDNEYINITDPPNPSGNLTLVGRGLTWDEYYNAVTGENTLNVYTGPVNYQDETGGWVPINRSLRLLGQGDPAYAYGYRVGNDQGLYNLYFKSNVQDAWPVAFAYNKSTNPGACVVRTKLVGVGYIDPSQGWRYEYLQNAQSSEGVFDGNAMIYDDVFTGTDLIYRYGNCGLKEEIVMGNITKALLQNHPPSEYGLSDQGSYLVFVTRFESPGLTLHNVSGVLIGNVTVFCGRVDFRDVLGRVRCVLPVGNAYELFDEAVRHRLVYRILQYGGDYYLLSGLKVSVLNNMSFPVVIDPTLDLDVMENDGYCYQTGSKYDLLWSAGDGEPVDADYGILIGQQKTSSDPSVYEIYRGFLFFNTTSLPSNAIVQQATLSLHKAADYSTADFDIIIQNGQPERPHSHLEADDYNKDFYDGNGGGFNTVNFTDGFNDISLTDYSWLTIEGFTKFCLRSSYDVEGAEPSGDEYVSVHANEFPGVGCHSILRVVYKNQSKIRNTGSTNISGFLLMQVQYYNETIDDWVVDSDAVNETTARIINASEQLGLDLIFNGLVNTDNLSHGDGMYRVYACFRDPEGSVLVCDDETLLEASYEFNVALS